MINRFDDKERQSDLAARATARMLLSAAAAQDAESSATAVTRSELWAYANREPGSPVPFLLEKAIRTEETIANSYRKLLSLKARGISLMAAAAYDNSATHRKLGDFTLDIIEEDGAAPALVIERIAGNAPAPTLIEAVSIEGVIRVALPTEVDRHIVLDLPRDDHERDLLRLMLANPAAGVYLL